MSENQLEVFGPGFIPGKVTVKRDGTRALSHGAVPINPKVNNAEQAHDAANEPKNKA